MRKNTVLFWKDIFSDHRHESRRLFGDLVGMGNFFIRRLHFGIIIAINPFAAPIVEATVFTGPGIGIPVKTKISISR